MFAIRVREILNVNYFAFRDTCNALFPILKAHARVVNVSSSAGHLSCIPGKHLRDVFASPTLTEAQLNDLMNSYVEYVYKVTVCVSITPLLTFFGFILQSRRKRRSCSFRVAGRNVANQPLYSVESRSIGVVANSTEKIARRARK